MAIKLSPIFAVHPGLWLREEIVAPRGLGIAELAEHFGVSRQAMSKLLNGRVGLSADMAIRFEKAFGLKAETLCRMQSAHDLAFARKSAKKIVVKAFRRAA
ncbi:MAG: HigA family addiction module antitoxin [Aestuariivirga sp.]|jgi:addiction module HigA family antidote